MREIKIIQNKKIEEFLYNKLSVIPFKSMPFFASYAILLYGFSYLAFCFHNSEGYSRVYGLTGTRRTLHSSELWLLPTNNSSQIPNENKHWFQQFRPLLKDGSYSTSQAHACHSSVSPHSNRASYHQLLHWICTSFVRVCCRIVQGGFCLNILELG